MAFLLGSPRILTCFAAEAADNPSIRRPGVPLELSYPAATMGVEPGSVTFRFALTTAGDHRPLGGATDVRVRSYRAPGSDLVEVTATESAPGIYEALLPTPHAGAYYAYVAVPSRKLSFGDLPFHSISVASSHAVPGTRRVALPGPRPEAPHAPVQRPR